MYHWLDAQGLAPAALSALWALAAGHLAGLAAMFGVVMLAARRLGLWNTGGSMGILTIAAWACLAGLVWPAIYDSYHYYGCKMDVTADLSAPFLAAGVVFARSLWGFKCGWRRALWLGLCVFPGLLISVITQGFIVHLLYPAP
jgi:hypothetical protein